MSGMWWMPKWRDRCCCVAIRSSTLPIQLITKIKRIVFWLMSSLCFDVDFLSVNSVFSCWAHEIHMRARLQHQLLRKHKLLPVSTSSVYGTLNLTLICEYQRINAFNSISMRPPFSLLDVQLVCDWSEIYWIYCWAQNNQVFSFLVVVNVVLSWPLNCDNDQITR